MSTRSDLDSLLQNAAAEIAAAKDLQTLDQIRVHYLGKKGLLTSLLKNLSQLSPDERPAFGQAVNQVKDTLQQSLAARLDALKAAEIDTKLSQEKIDVSLPGRGQNQGRLHPITRACERIENFFRYAGFTVVEGPEIEKDYYNFQALNIPTQHPARAMADTFYVSTEQGLLLRTHTSPVQIHVMENTKPPIKAITLGRVYRCDSDASHSPMFHQLECMMIDENITFAHLKGFLENFIQHFFERKDLAVRLRPSYFPFTEPSAEVDFQCVQCVGKGCSLCKQTGWLEIMGCGMVHPNVLNMAGIDSERYTGLAFAAGIDRLVMLRYGIPDLRLLFDNDLRLLGSC